MNKHPASSQAQTIVCDPEGSTVQCVAEDRKTDSLAAYSQQLTHEQRTGLKAVAMDMREPSVSATRNSLPAGDQRIVVDGFHILREMTKAVDTVRTQEHRSFLHTTDDSPLTCTTYLWFFGDERRPERHAESFATLRAPNRKVGRSWAISARPREDGVGCRFERSTSPVPPTSSGAPSA